MNTYPLQALTHIPATHAAPPINGWTLLLLLITFGIIFWGLK